jgi:hypothetical protein
VLRATYEIFRATAREPDRIELRTTCTGQRDIFPL